MDMNDTGAAPNADMIAALMNGEDVTPFQQQEEETSFLDQIQEDADGNVSMSKADLARFMQEVKGKAAPAATDPKDIGAAFAAALKEAGIGGPKPNESQDTNPLTVAQKRLENAGVFSADFSVFDNVGEEVDGQEVTMGTAMSSVMPKMLAQMHVQSMNDTATLIKGIVGPMLQEALGGMQQGNNEQKLIDEIKSQGGLQAEYLGFLPAIVKGAMKQSGGDFAKARQVALTSLGLHNKGGKATKEKSLLKDDGTVDYLNLFEG